MINIRLTYYLINTIILAILIFYTFYKKPNNEPFTDGDSLTVDEAISNVASLYNEENMTVSNLNITNSLNILPKGSIIAFSGNSAPSGWALCDGSTVTALDNTQLTTPDLRGRFILGTGNGTNLSQRTLNDTGGVENVTLTVNQIPAHNHTSAYFSQYTYNGRKSETSGSCNYKWDRNGTGCFSSISRTDNTGGGESHQNMPPFYVLTYIIKL